jgi:hypothetical protein
MVQDGRTSEQLRRILSKTNLSMTSGEKTRNGFTSPGTESYLTSQVSRYFQWKGGMAKRIQMMVQSASSKKDSEEKSTTTKGFSFFFFSHVSGSKSHSVPASSSKRRRVRGKVEEEAGTGKVFSIEAQEISNNLLEVEQVLNETSKTYNHSHIRIRAYSSMTSCVSGSPNNTSGENPDCTILDYIQPQWIVLFDPDIGFVRRYGETLILSWELQDSGPRDSR